MRRCQTAALVAVAAGTMLLATSGSVSAHEPNCGGLGGIAVHGQHVVGDYVMGGSGIGSGLEWPYRGLVGKEVSANGGAAVPGGPGPGFHFPNGYAPGASFCTGSNSPGAHI